MAESLGPIADDVARARAHLMSVDMTGRLWARDHTLWQRHPTEISDRLGWLDAPSAMTEHLSDLEAFAEGVTADGFERAVVLGMGGSSLFPEVLARTFPSRRLQLTVLDTTHPDAVRRVADGPLERTLFVGASKSGTTVETRSHLELFWNRVGRGEQFVVVTDPGSPLAALAAERSFRRVFESPPDVGGRYSALTFFGLVPAALHGVDVRSLLAGARVAADECRRADNPGLALGAAMGAAALAGRDKLTVVLPPELEAFGLWVEQLVAESLGKHGKGVVPVVGERLSAPDHYGRDRLFATVANGRAAASDDGGGVAALAHAGQPVAQVLELTGDREADLGRLVFVWEVATAVAGHVLGVHPFDQPDVAAAKAATEDVLRDGLPFLETPSPDGVLEGVEPGDYVAIQAYVDPGDEGLRAALDSWRARLRDRLGVAVTLGYGPRYLHSTGQLHKGGPPTGVFLQVVDDGAEDLAIPGRPYGFGTLLRAQAAGDLLALRRKGLPVARASLDDLRTVAARTTTKESE